MNAKSRNDFRHAYSCARVALNGARAARALGMPGTARGLIAQAMAHRATAHALVRA